MTSEQHLAAAEQLLAVQDNGVNVAPTYPTAGEIAEATAHALLAIAIELGAPHVQAQPEQAATQ